jgi:hypothetical protein
MKIPGYRSRKGWKMGLATFGYGFILLVIIIAIIDPSTEEAAAPVEAEEPAEVEEIEEEATEPETEEVEEVDEETVAENQYTSSFELSNIFIREEIVNLGAHLQVFANNEMWKEEYFEYVAELTDWVDDLRDLEDVPDKFGVPHSEYLEGVDDVLASIEMMSNAIETDDDGEIDYAVVVMERGIEKMNSAEQLYESMK